MASARPLHELLAGLSGDPDAAQGDPEAYLAAHGHSDLPADLVAEAVVSYADTAPVEVAEHLAPYVTAHSAVPTGEAPEQDWYGLLATAPDPDPAPDLDEAPPELTDTVDDDPGPALDFGTGASETLDTLDDASTVDTPASPDDAEQTPADHTSTWDDLEPASTDLDAFPEADDEDGDEDFD